uniref:Uncharacterized protein n=1 Tax=Strigamia maritima TaxID=126957 RepID=T1JHS9_STRMM
MVYNYNGANPALRDPRRGLNAKEWASFCGRKAAEKVIDSYLKAGKGFRENAARWFSKGDTTFGQRVKQIFSGRHQFDVKNHLFRASSAIVLPAAPSAFDVPSRPLHSTDNSRTSWQMPHIYISSFRN